ncbi:hypothetical protein XENTR_v10009013 [Xenopus tropicalis]|nr:hypothetical protein XENTR_v10009013 [Xenopus tropicalis]
METVLNGGEWELKQYGRLKGAGQSEETTSWKIFNTSTKSGKLILTILNTGHFFISQEHMMLQKSRIFKVQFTGESEEKRMENCHSCLQKLQVFIDLQNCFLMESSHYRPTDGSVPIKQITQCVMNQQSKGLDTSENPVAGSEELGMFIKLCLLDEHFPVFVESVEKELHKVAQNRVHTVREE